MEKLFITIDIDLIKKNVYIAETDSSGAKYDYKNVLDLVDKIKFYLTNYYCDEINKTRNGGINNE